MDDQGATGNTTAMVFVDVPPLHAYAGGPYAGMQGCPVAFTGNATGGAPSYTYHWSFGDGATSTEQNPSHAYSTGENFTVTLLVQDSQGRTNTDVTTATIGSDAIPPTVAIVTPATNMLYFLGHPLFQSSRTIIIGPVLVTVHATDNQTGVNHVEIYVDGSIDGLHQCRS